MNKRNKKRR